MPGANLSIEAELNRASKHASQKRWIQAGEIYTSILERFPNNPRARKGINYVQRHLHTTLPNINENQYIELLGLYEGEAIC